MRGKIVLAKVSGHKYHRISLVAAQIGNQFIAPMLYQNTMTSSFFEAWFEQCLLPALPNKAVIILDNARFHRMSALTEMAQKFNHVVLLLPPYSPELNPIERTWANIKRHMRSMLNKCSDITEAMASYSYFN